MGQCIDLVVPPGPFQLVEEELASWGGEAASFDPARYRYANISFRLISAVTHIREALPKKLQPIDSWLGIQEAVVASLAKLEPSPHHHSLGKLLAELGSQPAPWALVCDADVDDDGAGWRNVIVQDRAPSTEDVRSLLQAPIKERGLTIFVVDRTLATKRG